MKLKRLKEPRHRVPRVKTITYEDMRKYPDADELTNCPFCGHEDSGEYETLKAVAPDEYGYGAAMEFGGNPVSWYELHKCSKCGKKFCFENSNY